MVKTIEMKFHVGDNVYVWNELKMKIEPVKICRIEITLDSTNYYGADGIRYSGADIDEYVETPSLCVEASIKRMEKALEVTIRNSKAYCENEIEAAKKNHLKDIKKLNKSRDDILSEE